MTETAAHADAIFENGTILTMDAPAEAEAVAIGGGRILSVGSREAVHAAHRGPQTRVVDLRGRPLLPGFVDAHTHLVDHGVALMRLNLARVASAPDLLAAVRERAKMTPEGGWVVGTAWDESRWADARLPTLAELDAAAGPHPAVLARVDMHMGLANTAAQRAVGLPASGAELREDDFYRVWDAVKPSGETLVKAVGVASRRSHELGVTSVGAIVDARDLAALQEARARGSLGVRCACYVREGDFRAFEVGGDAWLRVNGVKLFTDGSIGSRTAAVTGCYCNHPEEHGQFIYEDARLFDLLRDAKARGMQPALHAIGDAAIDQALRAFETVGFGPDERPRIEHLELFTDKDVARMRALGAIASMQPNFIGEWGFPGQMYAERLGADVVGKHNRLRVLADARVPLAFGSDHMPYGPLYGIHYAVNAPTPAQRLTVEEALRAYTIGAAHANRTEREVGSLAPGKLADLVILSEDPRRAPERIKELRVEETWVDGKRVHARAA